MAAGYASRREAAREAAWIRIEHALLPWVAFLIVPLFALANAGGERAASRGARERKMSVGAARPHAHRCLGVLLTRGEPTS